MDQEKLNFINNEFPGLLKKTYSGHTAQMGTYESPADGGASHGLCQGGYRKKNPASLMTSEEHLPAYKRFLEGDKQFRENTKNPLNTGDPNPVRTKDLQSAIDEYLNEMKEFYATFEKQPGLKTIHPSFGRLDASDWMRMQYKHLRHHARQFGLIED